MVVSTAREIPKSITRAVVGEQHVGGFQVAVHHARRVDRGEAFGATRGEGAHRGNRSSRVP